MLVGNATESDASVVRYFSAYWPLFEMGGVAIAPDGRSALMAGMESGEFAKGRSVIDNIHLMKEYRETADPVYPGMAGSTYRDVFESIGVSDVKRIGVAGYLCTNMAMYEGLRESFPDAEIVNADELTAQLRSRKSPAELACLREGFRLGELALEAMLDAVKPGMTELELAGIAVSTLYANGAEGEAHTVYSFGGKKTTNGISRSTHRRLRAGRHRPDRRGRPRRRLLPVRGPAHLPGHHDRTPAQAPRIRARHALPHLRMGAGGGRGQGCRDPATSSSSRMPGWSGTTSTDRVPASA